MKKKTILTILLVFTIAGVILATTWMDVKIVCPVCETKNDFKKPGSYGGYIYNWPSKFEYIYWPVTETYSIYSCRKCRYSAFMWDFKRTKGDTLSSIKNAIDTLPIKMKAHKDYTKIPVSEKLETAELFYKLYNTDNDFWSRFYRIKGYHYNDEGNVEEAKKNRLKALIIADSMLNDTSYQYRKKELLLITGAMKHFTGEDSLAVEDFKLAQELKYNDPKANSSYNQGMEEYLQALLIDFVKKINNPEEETEIDETDN